MDTTTPTTKRQPTAADRKIFDCILALIDGTTPKSRGKIRAAILHGIGAELDIVSPSLGRLWRMDTMQASPPAHPARDTGAEIQGEPRILSHPAVAHLPAPIRMVAGLMSDMSDDIQELTQGMVEDFYLSCPQPWLNNAEREALDEDDD
jgi:hypothetical protein